MMIAAPSARPLLSALAGDPEVAGLLSDAAQVQAMLAFERALADASASAGLIGEDAARAIRSAIETFEPDWPGLAEGMARDGVVVPALVGQIRARLDPAFHAALHLGATSQDVIDTALVLQLAKIIAIFEARLVALQRRFGTLSEANGSRALMSHTRMQKALPITVADKIRNWNEPLGRYLLALAAARQSLLVIQLGGPVGDRSSFAGKGDLVAKYLAEQLDLGLAAPWHAMRDPIVGFGSLLALISGSLGKFGADVTLMAQNEVHEITLAGGGTSSAMAHKSNPVKAEVLVTLARFNAGMAGTLQQAMVHENERSGATWTLEWLVLPPMLEATGASLRLAAELVEQVGFGA
jgi:3-carboxy-cis,cis-muconate cycloisomerase